MNNDIIPGFDDELDDSLKIRLEKIDGSKSLIIFLDGYIDTYNSTFFQTRISKIIQLDYINLIFSCKSLNYVSSTGIGSFTTFLKALKPKGGNVVLVDIQPKVYEVFQLLGFAQFFVIKETLAEAKVFFLKDVVADSSNIFPKIFDCPICDRKLKAIRAGRFRCGECKSIIAVDDQANILLG